MKAFFIAFVIGIFEVTMLYLLMNAVGTGNRRRVRCFFGIKFLSYGLALWLLTNKYFSYYIYCFCGFIVGFPIFGILIFIYTTFFKSKRKAHVVHKSKKSYFRR